MCVSWRSLTYGRCTRSAAGSFSLLETVSGSSTRISWTDLLLRLFLQTVTSEGPRLLQPFLLRSTEPLFYWRRVLLWHSDRTYSTGPPPKPFSQLFLIQTLNSPSLPQHPAHFFWNALNSDIVHRKYQSIYCTECDWWHVKDYGLSCSTFTVSSKQY